MPPSRMRRAVAPPPHPSPRRVLVAEVELARELDVAYLRAAALQHGVLEPLHQRIRDEVVAAHHDRQGPGARDLVHGLPQRGLILFPLDGVDRQVAEVSEALADTLGVHLLPAVYLHRTGPSPLHVGGIVVGRLPVRARPEPGADARGGGHVVRHAGHRDLALAQIGRGGRRRSHEGEYSRRSR